MSFYDDIINRATERATEDAKKRYIAQSKKKSEHDMEIVSERLTNAIYKSIGKFYEPFEWYGRKFPYYYERNESMYNLPFSDMHQDILDISFEPKNMTTYRNPTGDLLEGLYKITFKQGWHGGAIDKGGTNKMRYRTPHPSEALDKSGKQKHGYYNWGAFAHRADISPLADIQFQATMIIEEMNANGSRLKLEMYDGDWYANCVYSGYGESSGWQKNMGTAWSLY